MEVTYIEKDLDSLYYTNTLKILANPNLKLDVYDFVKKISNYIDEAEQVKKILLTKRNKLSDEEFLETINNFCYIDLEEKEMFKLLKNLYHQNYVDFEYIMTDMVKRIDNEECLLTFDAIIAEDVKIRNKLYTIKEIKKLVDSKKIILIKELYNGYKGEFQKEKYQYFPLMDVDNLINNSLVFRNLLYKYVRQHVKTSDLIMVLNEYLNYLKNSLQTILFEEKFQYEKEYTDNCRDTLIGIGKIRKLERLIRETNQK